MLRSKPFGEADTRAHPAVKPTMDDEGIGSHFRRSTLGVSWRIKATEQKGVGVHAVAGRVCSPNRHLRWHKTRKFDLDPQSGVLTLKKVTLHEFDTSTHLAEDHNV